MGPAPVPKIRELDRDGLGNGNGAGSVAPTAANTLKCTLHPRALTFNTYDAYDAHYNKQHVNRCRECKKNFPSDHILGLHIEECHDSFLAALRDKGEHTYACFVEGCDRKCRDSTKRRRHLIDKHTYPPNFFFDVTKYGIDGRHSLLCDTGTHRRTHSKGDKPSPAKTASAVDSKPDAPATVAVDGENPQKAGSNKGNSKPRDAEMSTERPATSKDVDMEMDSLAGGMSSLKLVPRSISFGRGGRKVGFSRSH